LGGLFAVHTLTTRPDLFNAYIAISPSMQWNAQHLVDQAEQFFTATPQLPVSLYMTAGNEGGELLGGTRRLAGVLDAATPKDFLWQFDHLPLETHGSVPSRSTYQGLEFVFANWQLRNPYDFYANYGMGAIEQFYAVGDKRYGVDRGIPFMTTSYLLSFMTRDGDLDGAVDLMNKPSVIKNAFGGQFGLLANTLRDSGDKARAIHFYRIALQKNPGDMMARSALDEWDVDYSDLVPQLQIESHILQRYEGVYSSTSIPDITVQAEDGRLYRELNATRFQLHPVSDSEFYLQEVDVRYNFQLTSSGEVSGIRIKQGGTTILAERR
jgi:pimeloyl-ACP methyl ester carboxylesterase